MNRLALLCLVPLAAPVFGQTPVISTLAHFEGVAPAANKGNGARDSLIFGADGQLYGVTEQGGTADLGAAKGYGSLFKIDTAGTTFTPLFDFAGASNGSKPTGRLLLASDGNYYGTTSAGGADGLGTVFQLTPGGTLSTVYSFALLTRSNTGAVPTSGLVEAPDGYLYGTTTTGGFSGYGTIFKILPSASSTPIRVIDFSGDGGTRRGGNPSALMRASDGNFYGTTETGGLYGNGTVFKLTPAGVFATISDFGAVTGVYTGPVSPRAPLIQASNGILYGTSAGGGTLGQGTVFSVTTAGVYAAIINFSGTTGTTQGSTPEAALMQATNGLLYGTTRLGGSANRGTVFRVAVSGSGFSSLAQFTGGVPVYGAEPRGGLVQDNEGHLFGTCWSGGLSGFGTVFRLDNALPQKASVFTTGLLAVSGTRATLSGSVNPQGTPTLYWFEYGLTTSYTNSTVKTSAGAGTTTLVDRPGAISGLTPFTTYHYRIVASNGGGTSWGADQVFVTGPNPNIVTPPADQLVGIGTAAQFDVTAIGATKYAWLKNGAGAALGSAASYRIASTQLSHAGTYTVNAIDGADSVASTPARLGVISVADTSIIVNEGEETTLKLASAGPGLSFQWKTTAGNVVDSLRITGSQTTALRISNAGAADTAVYFCEVTLGTLTLNSGNFTLTTRLRPVINPPSLGPWTTNGSATGSISALNSPVTYIAVGLPSGVTMNTTTGIIMGRPTAPGVYPVQFSAKNLAGTGPVLPYLITVLAPSPNADGTYAGNIDRHAANTMLGGSITFTIGLTGTGTGSAAMQGRTFSFKAGLSSAPGATRSIAITPSTVQPGFPAIIATLTEATGDIAGSVAGAPFTARRVPAQGAHPVPVPVAQAGLFNVALSLPSAHAGDPTYPQGAGHGGLTITGTSGAAIFKGKLADNTSFTRSSWFVSNDTVPVHLYLVANAVYAAGTGSAQGSLAVDNAGVVTETTFDWLKLSQPATPVCRSYHNGFPRVDLEADGGRYAKPAIGVNVLGLTGSTSNARFDFTQGGLAPDFSQILSLPATNVPVMGTPTPNTVKITGFDLNTGIFKGTFLIAGATSASNRTAAFEGVLIPRLNRGFGQFQLPGLSPSLTTSDILSGQVVLGQNP